MGSEAPADGASELMTPPVVVMIDEGECLDGIYGHKAKKILRFADADRHERSKL